MYCPNCGNQIAADQKFCRACGLGLEKITQSVGEQLPVRLERSLRERQEWLEKVGVGSLSVFALGLLGFLLYAVAQKLGPQGSLFTILALVGLVIVFGSGLLSVILFARARELKESAGKRRLTKEVNALDGSTKELLPEGKREPVPAVTEHTTELLYAEKLNSGKFDE